MAVGFNRENEESPGDTTPYDHHVGNVVRLDIAGGIGLTGTLQQCKICDHGYSFSVSPAIVYGPDEMPRLSSEESQLTSNGNAISIIPIEKDLSTYVADIVIAKKERDFRAGQARQQSKRIILP